MDADPVLKILFVEDLPSDMELAVRELRKDSLSFASHRVEAKDTFLEALMEFQPDLVISDYSMPSFDGRQALTLSMNYDPDLPVIILTGALNEDTAVECMKAGAVDYVIKEHIARLPLAVRSALEQKAIRRAKQISEKELLESEEHLRLALDAADLGTWRHDLLTGQIHFDQRSRGHFGFDRDDVLFTDVIVRAHPDDAAMIGQAMAAAMDPAGDGRVSIEHRLIQPGGAMNWLSIAGRAYFEGQGAARHAVLFVGTSQNISERKHSEALLERYRLLSERARDIMVFVRLDGRILEANQAAEQAYGYTRQELLSLTVTDLRAPETHANIIEQMQQANSSGILFETSHRRKDGSIFPVEVSSLGAFFGDEHINLSVVRDISERKRVQETLRESEERYRLIVENATVGIVVHIDNKIVYGNHAALRMIGESDPTALLGRSIIEFVHPEERAMILALVQATLAPDQPVSPDLPLAVEERLIRLDGSIITVEASAIVINYYGKPALMVMMNDITERKGAELALREQVKLQDQLAKIAVTVPGMISSMRRRPDGSLSMPYSTPALQDLYGLQPEDVLEDATPALLLIHPDDMSHVSEAMAESARNLTPFRDEWRVRHPRRGEIWVEGHTMPLREPDGSTLWQGFIQDITERKQAEQELRDREAQYRAVIETTMDGFWVADTQGRLLEVNDSIARRSGYTRQELLGMSISDLEAKENPQETQAHIEKNMRTGSDLFETILRTKDGALWQAEINVSYSTIAGGRIFSFVRDIGERKQMEEALRQRLTEAEAQFILSAALRTANTIEEALPVLLDQSLAALDSEAGNIWLYNPAAGNLYLAVARGWFKQLYGISLIPGQGIVGAVFSRGQFYQSADLANDPLSDPPTGLHIPPGQGGICVPMRTAEETIGVLMVSLPSDRKVSPGQLKLITSLTEMAGLALHGIRLHEETVRHMKQLEVVRAIDQAITSSLDLKLTLNILLEHITSQLKVDAASVLLLQPATGILDFAAGHGFRTRAIERSKARLASAGGTGPLRLKGPAEMRPAAKGALRFEACGLDRAGLIADEGFVTYHCLSLVAKGVQKGVLEIFHRAPLNPDDEWLNFLETLAGQAAIAIDNYQLFENLQLANWNLSDAYDATIEGWSHALDLRDKETEGHTLRVTELTLKLARQLGVAGSELTFIRWGALLHDIGKMGIPDQILLKPGPLNEEEWLMMRKHPRFAFDLLTPISYLGRAVDIPYCHHEKWDGTGYPRGLKGEEIPLMARLFSIVDVWDAICSDRPYRPAFTRGNALAYILAEKGISFDPRVVETFVEMIKNSRDGE